MVNVSLSWQTGWRAICVFLSTIKSQMSHWKAFGILVYRWRISNTPINGSVENVERYVRAAKVLHYYLRQTENATWCPQRFVNCEESDGSIKKEHWQELANNNNSLLTPLKEAKQPRVDGMIDMMQWWCVMLYKITLILRKEVWIGKLFMSDERKAYGSTWIMY